MRERPLSPHLSVYRFRYTLTTSILNRATGLALSVALLPLAWWLMAVAGGKASYERALPLLSSGVCRLIYAAALFAFFYHLVAGIRHLVWDTGYGLERTQSQRSAWIVVIASVVLALSAVYWMFAGHPL
jgi:succinate dehydrogenase / fumarate reductase, cytochrome b subunit